MIKEHSRKHRRDGQKDEDRHAVPGKRSRAQQRYAGVVQRKQASGNDMGTPKGLSQGHRETGELNYCPADMQSTPDGKKPRLRPFENGVTRGDFVWALAFARPDLGLGSDDRDQVLKNATERGVLAGGLDDNLNRADAATILVRLLKIDQVLPEGQVAYFYDVPPGVYYHETAHAARLYGIFRGGGDNLFRPGDSLSEQEAFIVINRARSPRLMPPEKQTNGAEPMLQPNAALGMLNKKELGADDIALVRAAILQLPEDQRADLYRQLNSKVTYRNQRDNAAKYTLGDYMCNVTSLAMAFNQLGYGADDSEKQFEDSLDEGLQEAHGLPADTLAQNPRYHESGQRELAEERGLGLQRIYVPLLASASDIQVWFEKNVKKRMEQGQAATMSIRTPIVGDGHIVRVEWIESNGVKVDDPFGALQNGGGYGYNDKTSAEDAGARGEDNLWTWELLASNGVTPRYVQFLF